jgi:hypothetical protein
LSTISKRERKHSDTGAWDRNETKMF